MTRGCLWYKINEQVYGIRTVLTFTDDCPWFAQHKWRHRRQCQGSCVGPVPFVLKLASLRTQVHDGERLRVVLVVYYLSLTLPLGSSSGSDKA